MNCISHVQLQVSTAMLNQTERKHSISVKYGVWRNGALLLWLHGNFIIKLTRFFSKNHNYSHKIPKNIVLHKL